MSSHNSGHWSNGGSSHDEPALTEEELSVAFNFRGGIQHQTSVVVLTERGTYSMGGAAGATTPPALGTAPTIFGTPAARNHPHFIADRTLNGNVALDFSGATNYFRQIYVYQPASSSTLADLLTPAVSPAPALPPPVVPGQSPRAMPMVTLINRSEHTIYFDVRGAPGATVERVAKTSSARPRETVTFQYEPERNLWMIVSRG